MQIDFKNRILNVFYKNKKSIIIILISVAILLISLPLLLKNNNIEFNQYEEIESIMLYNAKDYTANNNINKETYISLNELGITIDNSLNCNSQSGVLYSENKYYVYLICDKYYSQEIENINEKNKKNEKYASLNGEYLVIASGEYTEPGVKTKEGYNVNIKTNNLNSGLNIIKYSILKNNRYIGELKRIVIVANALQNAPIITLIGNKYRTLVLNSTYIESGYTAIDEIDGNITDKVIVSGNVDTSIVGTATITYAVTNSRGITATATRYVTINSKAIDLTINSNVSYSNQDYATISLEIIGNGYDHTVLPNKTNNVNTKITYKVYKDGLYEFIVYDKNNNSEVKTIEVKGLNISFPVVTCSVEAGANNSLFTVNATDPDGISSYVYKYNSKTSKSLTSNTYSVAEKVSSASVIVSDSLGNKTTSTCTIKETVIPIDPLTPPEKKVFTGVGAMSEYTLFIPSNNTKKMPLIIFLPPSDAGYQLTQSIFQNWSMNPIPAYVLVPKLYNYTRTGGLADVIKVIDKVKNNYNIDEKRISALGASSSGTYVYMLVGYNQEYFAAMVPISSGVTSTYDVIKDNLSFWKSFPMKGFGEAMNVQYDGTKRCGMTIAWNPAFAMKTLFDYLNRPADFTDMGQTCHGDMPQKVFAIDKNNDNNSDIIMWLVSQKSS